MAYFDKTARGLRSIIMCFERLELKTIRSTRKVIAALDTTNCLILLNLYGIFITEVIRK